MLLTTHSESVIVRVHLSLLLIRRSSWETSFEPFKNSLSPCTLSQALSYLAAYVEETLKDDKNNKE